MKKTVLIPWSGGLDSTYLVYKNLKEGNIVKTFSVSLGNNPNQAEREKASRIVLTKWFNEKFPENKIDEYPLDHIISVRGRMNTPLPQPPLWILNCFYCTDLCDVDEIQIGYVMNDCALSYLDEIKRLYNAYSGFVECKLPKLTFPIIKKTKADIASELPEFIVKNISYCEYYGEKGCNCASCEKHNKEIKQTKYDYLLIVSDTDDKIKITDDEIIAEKDDDLPCNNDKPVYMKTTIRDVQLCIEFPNEDVNYSLN